MQLFSCISSWFPFGRKQKYNRRSVTGSRYHRTTDQKLRLAVEQLECRELLSGLTAAIVGSPVSGHSPEGKAIYLSSHLTGTTPGLTYSYSWQVLKNNAAYAAGTASTLTFTPNDNAAYQVALTVTDKLGDSATASQSITVDNVPPTLHVASAFVGTALKGLTFTASATDPSSVDTAAGFTYAWNFGDSTSGSGAAPSHSYAKPGNYTVTVTATDKDGGTSATGHALAYVHAPAAPTVSITGVPALARSPEGTAITLGSTVQGTTAGDTYTLTWNVLKNGKAFATGSGSSVTFTPDDDGSYLATLTVIDTFGTTVRASRVITALDVAPTVQVAASFNGAALSPLAFSASATSPGPVDMAAGFRFVWSFGDGATGTGAAPTHTYARPGTYTARVNAYDKDGALGGTATTKVTVIQAITATFSGPSSVKEGTTNAVVAFANVAGGSGGFTYSYDFNNDGVFEITGSTSTSATIPEQYVDNGPATRVVRGRVTDSNGDTRDFTYSITVLNVPPTPVIDAPALLEAHMHETYSDPATDPSTADTNAGFTYTWNFGDGTAVVTGEAPSHTYAAPGNYTITVTATDQNGGSGSTTTPVTVLPAPTASFSGPVSVNEGTGTAQVSFGNPTGGTGIYTYSYDFNNDGNFEITGSSSATATIPESYLDDGPSTRVVHGRITDSGGNFTDYTTSIHVINVAPSPSFTAPSGMEAGMAVAFKGSATDPSTADTNAGFTYSWNYGDGTAPGSGSSVSHAFAAAGTYTVTLSATDKDGGVGTTSNTITIGTRPTATFSDPKTVNEGNSTTQVSLLNATGGTGVYTYSFDFNDDGNFEIVNSPNPTASVPESYLDDGPSALTVLGRVSDSAGGYSDYTTKITVNNVAPTPTITAPPGTETGDAVTFQGSATDPSTADTNAGFTYAWNFGDGSNPVSGTKPSHTFTAAGTYTVTLTTGDKDGGIGTTSVSYTVAPPPTATFSGPSAVNEGTSTAQVSFANPTGGTGGYTYSYDFNNDGNFEITNSSNPTATIPESYLDDGPATHTVHGRITDSSGGASDYTAQVTVNNVAPTPSISTPSGAEAGTAAAFQASATDPSTADTNAGFTYSWNFGDGTSPVSGANPSHTFAAAGTYTITLSATDKDNGTSSTSVSFTVGTRPTATFGGPASVTEGTANAQVTFTSPTGGTGGYTYSYDFDNDGKFEITGSSTANATIPESYLDDGPSTRVVHGRITDSFGGYTDYTTSITVTNVAPTPTITAPSTVDAGMAAAFKASATDPSTADTSAGFTYSWNFGDGTSPVSGANPSHTFTTAGTYTVKVTATDKDGGAGTASVSYTVAPLPTATFSGPSSVTEGTSTAQVAFASSAGGTGSYTYSYDFNNDGNFEITGSSSTSATIPESYLDDGPSTRTVHGRITDSLGGFTDYTTKITVTNVAPTPSITAPASVDVGMAAAFKGSATDPSTADTNAGFTYSWNFGDGSSPVAGANASHTYTAAGTYTVKLTATDKDGGAGSTTVSYIVAALPTATFGGPSSVNEGTSTAKVTFTSSTGGSGGYTYSYDFNNDGNFEITGSSTASATIPESYVDDGPSTRVVHGRITDSLGGYTDYTTSITVTNVAPTATFSNTGPVNIGTAVTVKFTNPSDPSTADTNAGFHYSFAQSQNALATTYAGAGTGTSANYTYNASGTYTVYGRIFDKDNGSTDYTTQVTVNNPTQLTVVLQTTPANPGSAETLLAVVSGPYTGSLSYSWTFGDGTTQTTTTPMVSHSYATTGSYTAKVTVTDSLNAQGSSTATVAVSATALLAVTLDGSSFGLVGAPVSFTVSNQNQPPAGGFTYAWNFGDGSSDTTSVPADSHAYATAGNYVATITVSDSKGDKAYASAAVVVNPSSSSTDPLYTPVVNSTSFSYLGSFALPHSANNSDTAYSMGGLAYRYVNGNLQFFGTNSDNSGNLVYEFNYPGISSNQSNLPQAQVVKNWGDIYTGQKLDDYNSSGALNSDDPTYGLYYDSTSNELYWTYGDSYNAQYPTQQSIGYSTLNDATGVATGAGAWSLANRPEKFDRGGIVQIPQWFANRYTGGDTLGVGFGGYYSIVSTASLGPALAAIAPPNPANNADDSALPNVPLLGYPYGAADEAHRDTGYASTYEGTQWNPANGTGYWTWSDSIMSGGTWINTPTMQGVLFIAKVGQGNTWYQNSDRHAQSGSFEWMVYNPADLAAVASGAKQQWQIQPEYEWTTPTLPLDSYEMQNGYSGDGYETIGGIVFDPTTNRMYVQVEGATGYNGSETWPEMYVYQVGPPPAASSSTVVGDGQSGFSKSGTGWTNTPNGYGGESMQTTTSATATASWQAAGLAVASYTLSVDWNAMPNTNTTAAVYKIYDGSTLLQTVTINQSQTPSGKVVGGTIFQSLGTFNISSGSLTVVLSNGATGSLTADALLIESTGSSSGS
jgi:PKD repeat protein